MATHFVEPDYTEVELEIIEDRKYYSPKFYLNPGDLLYICSNRIQTPLSETMFKYCPSTHKYGVYFSNYLGLELAKLAKKTFPHLLSSFVVQEQIVLYKDTYSYRRLDPRVDMDDAISKSKLLRIYDDEKMNTHLNINHFDSEIGTLEYGFDDEYPLLGEVFISNVSDLQKLKHIKTVPMDNLHARGLFESVNDCPFSCKKVHPDYFSGKLASLKPAP